MTVEKCDLCDSTELENVYTPRGTKRGLSVYVCQFCGLVQSLPRIDHVEDRIVSTSGDADWGNVRYGKGFRAELAVEMLWGHIEDTNEEINMLDVGAGKGAFILAFNFHKRFPNTITLIEPDATLKPESFEIFPREVTVDTISWITKRFEEVAIPSVTYDVVHCSHTLEHMKSPMATLKKIWDTMTMGGLLFVEVPNIEIIGSVNFVEEFFIDKHLYHFSYLSLAKYLRWTDFEIVEANITKENVSIVTKKVEYGYAERKGESRDALLLQGYADTKLLRPLFAGQQARRINALADKKRVLIWGAGRIFDLLRRAGLGSENGMPLTVDKYLPDRRRPSKLPKETIASIDLLVIASREYAKEIEKEARDLGFGCEIVVWNEVE